MRKALKALLWLPLLILAGLAVAPAFAQRLNDRVVLTINAPPGQGLPPLLGVPGAIISLCNYPANGVPCTNTATSYTDGSLVNACPAGYPVVAQGSATCVNHADNSGAIGFWVQQGCYVWSAQDPRSNNMLGQFNICTGGTGGGGGGGSGGGVNVFTITGANPTIQTTSSTQAGIDVNYLTMTNSVSSIGLTALSNVADGEQMYVTISQPSSGAPFSIAAGSAGSPFTPPSGAALVNAVPGGCPPIGSNVSSTTPSQTYYSITYQKSLTEFQILGCSASTPTAQGVVEFTLQAGPAQLGQIGLSIPLQSIVPQNSGHFGSITVTYLGGTCTTQPTFNVFDNTTAGVALQAPSTAGTSGTQAQTLVFTAGDTLSIQETVVGTSCTQAFYSVAATVLEP